MRSRLVVKLCAAAAVSLQLGCGSGAGGNPSTSAPSKGLTAAELNGVYRMTIAPAAVAQHDGVPVAEATAENYGQFTLVLRDGHFALTQHNPKACTWQY